MHVTAVLTRDDLASLIESLTPLRVELKERSQHVALGRPTLVELVESAGLRVRGSARFTWSIAGVAIPVTLRAWQILLAPSIVVRDGAHVLAFDPILEELDFERLPAFAAQRITAAINDGLAGQRRRLAWNFTRTLSYTRTLPDRVSPVMRFDLRPTGGTVTVTADEIHVTAEFRALVLRPAEKPRPIEAPPSSRAASR